MITPLYTDTGKFYRTQQGLVVSAGRIVTALTGETFDHIPLNTLKMAEQEGTGAHRIGCDIALMRLGHMEQVPVPKMPADYPGDISRWADAMARVHVDLLNWFDQYEVEPIAVEEPSANYTYGYAGQPDMKAWWKPRPVCKRRQAVFDYKRVAQIMDGHRLKLMLYKMLDGYKDCQDAVIVWLQKAGGIKTLAVDKSYADEAALLGMATAIRWQQMKGYVQVPR